MTLLLEVIGLVLIWTGIAFLGLAALGAWRLPDVMSRLHALTKADSAGLALVALGAACLSGSVAPLLPLMLCALLVAVSGATVGHLVARAETRAEAPR